MLGWLVTILMVSMVVSMMARKGKGKQVEKDQGKGKAKAKGKQVASKGKGKVKGRGKSTLALRDEPTGSDTDMGEDPTIGNMTATEAREWRGRRGRSHSSGIYGANVPREPKRINISDGQ